MLWELPYSIARGLGQGSAGESLPSCYLFLAFFIPSDPIPGGARETEKQDCNPGRTGMEERAGELSIHAGLCLQTLWR